MVFISSDHKGGYFRRDHEGSAIGGIRLTSHECMQLRDLALGQQCPSVMPAALHAG